MSLPGPPVIVTGKVIQEQASLILDSHPQTSIRRMSSHLGISMTSVRHIYNALEFKLYIPRLIHKLNEDDFDLRVEFWETLLSIIANEPDIIKHVIWSDEATFKVNGVTNSHNSVYWRKENPHITYEHTMLSEGFTVWSGLWYDGAISLNFFEDTVTPQSYLTVLNDCFYPFYWRLSRKNPFFVNAGWCASTLRD